MQVQTAEIVKGYISLSVFWSRRDTDVPSLQACYDSVESKSAVEPQYNKTPREWKNVFLITGVCYVGVLFHTFYYYWTG